MQASARWRIFSLDELIQSGAVRLGRGRVISKTDLAETPGTFPVYSSAREGDGKFGGYGKYLFDEELITWSVDGGGRLFHRLKHKFSVTNVGGFLRVLRKDLISYRFLYYALTLEHSRVRFDWVKKAHPSTLRKEYKNIPLPSLSEQKRIVAILDEVFEGIDTAVANAEKNLANARELFETHLGSVFGLDASWVKKTVGELADHSLGKMLDKQKNRGTLKPYLRNLNVRWFGFDLNDVLQMPFEDDEADRYTAIIGDVLMCEGGYPGRCAIWDNDEPIYIQKAIHRVRFQQQHLNKWFVYFVHFLDMRDRLREHFTGSGIQHFTGQALHRFNVPLPPPDDLGNYVVRFDAHRDLSQELEAVYCQKLEHLKGLKQAILQKAFTGELTERSVEAVKEAAE